MTWTIDESEAGTRSDVVIAQRLNCSRSEASRLLDQGEALVNGLMTKPGYKVRRGDEIEANRPEPSPTDIIPEAIPLNIVFEDHHLLVIDKPTGMVVHPAPGSPTGTLVNAVLAHADDLSGIGGENRPGIVHRLDKDTSGLLVVAKSDDAHLSLQRQIQLRTAKRIYRTLVWGPPRFTKMRVDAPIGRHPVDRKKMAVVADERHMSRDALTDLELLETLGEMALLEARLMTGRTHQIRVHCSYIGYPVVGDKVYGGKNRALEPDCPKPLREALMDAFNGLQGQALHAHMLSFDHPITDERMEFVSPIRADMQVLIDAMRAVYCKEQ